MGEKPRYSVSAASKAEKGKHVKLISLWQRENGLIGGCLSDEVECIVMKNGVKISNDNAWINAKDWEAEFNQEPPEQQAAEKNQAYQEPDAADVPF